MAWMVLKVENARGWTVRKDSLSNQATKEVVVVFYATLVQQVGKDILAHVTLEQTDTTLVIHSSV
jgi:hypothetical protein